MSAARRVRFKNILCPTDFSEFARRALRHAVALARRFDAQVSVLHVIPQPPAYAPSVAYVPTLPLVASPELRKLTAADLRDFVEPLRAERVGFALEVREGEPWREIRAAAELLPADLLVMGTHGRGGFERMLLGSVTQKLVHSVGCPVLTVCHEEGRTWDAPGLLSRILCATDLSSASERTIAAALSFAAESQARVTLLHVMESASREAVLRHAPPLLGKLPPRHEGLEAAALVLKSAVPDEARAWCEIVERIESGKVRETILRVAAEERSDMIVVGSRGGGALGGLFYGSTAVDVIRAATCPVLVAKEPLRGIDADLTRAQTALTSTGTQPT